MKIKKVFKNDMETGVCIIVTGTSTRAGYIVKKDFRNSPIVEKKLGNWAEYRHKYEYRYQVNTMGKSLLFKDLFAVKKYFQRRV